MVLEKLDSEETMGQVTSMILFTHLNTIMALVFHTNVSGAGNPPFNIFKTFKKPATAQCMEGIAL